MSDVAPFNEPFSRFDELMREAKAVGADRLPEPTAFSLGTIGADGQPAVRILLLKGVDERGFVFFTNYESQKGRELLAHPQAAMCFHWQPLERQVRVQGVTTPVSAEEADEYFATRARGSQIGAWASQQSRPIKHPGDLEARVREVEARFADREVTRPPHWSGFRLVPTDGSLRAELRGDAFGDAIRELREIARQANGSGVEHVRSPAVAFANVDVPLVQTARHAAPELDAMRNQPKAGPVRRTRDVLALEARLDVAHARLEITRSLDRPALLRRPRADLAPARAAGEVRIRLLARDRPRTPFDAHLPLERLPVKAHRRLRMRDQLAPLAALVVRVENEAFVVHALQQQNADGGLSIRAHGSERE